MFKGTSAILGAAGVFAALLFDSHEVEASTWANMPGSACAWDSVDSQNYNIAGNAIALGVKNSQFWMSGEVTNTGSGEQIYIDCPIGNTSTLPDSSIQTVTINFDMTLCTKTGWGCNGWYSRYIRACVVSATGFTTTCGTISSSAVTSTGYTQYSLSASALQGDTTNSQHPYIQVELTSLAAAAGDEDWADYILGYYVSD